MARSHVRAQDAWRAWRRGSVLPAVAVALTVLLGLTGLAIDFGMVSVALQQCQTVADAGALAGAQELPDFSSAVAEATAAATANIRPAEIDEYSVAVNTYAEGEQVGDVGPAPRHGALEVTATRFVPYRFLPVLGFQGTTVSRSAVATHYLGGTCILPMWIWHDTPVHYGLQVNLLMAAGPHCGIPGSFGFLEPAGGVSFQSLLKGLVTPQQEELQRVDIGDTVWAKTGLAVAHWRGPLKTDSDSRLNRASQPPWNNDTFASFHADNPRILIVPFVEYVAGTGSNAHFVIRDFGAFWLEDVITQGSRREIQGRFIDFARPGGLVFGLRPGQLVR